MNKLFELALECAKNGHTVSLAINNENKPEFTIHIGSKTGTGKFYEVNEIILLETRYNRISEIQSYDDIGEEAYDWYLNYKDREPFTQPDSAWADYFVKRGWLKKTTKTFYE